MTTSHPLTGDFNDLLVEEPRITGAWLETNLPAGTALVDLDANKVLLAGPKRITLDASNTFSISLIATNSTGTNVTDGTLRYRVRAQYSDGTGVPRTWESGWFDLTAAADLSDKVGGAGDLDVTIAPSASLIDAPTAANVTGPSQTRTALDAAYAGKAASRRDGQNVKHLRRPTLTVSKMYPNASHDHEIVWVDEVNREAFAIGQDDRLRRGTWAELPSEESHAMYFDPRIAAPPSGKKWCSVGTFLRIRPKTGLANGAILLDERDAGQGVTTNTVLKRSTSDPTSGSLMTFATVWTAPDGVTLLGPNSLAVDEVTGYIYLVEYMPSGTPATEASIWRSTDDGATWTKWYTYPRADSGTGNIRHFHSARWDSVSQRIWFTVGDFNDDAGLWRVSADGSTVEKVVTNVQVAAQTGQSAAARAVDVMFLPNHIAWPCDGSGGINYLTIMHRNQIGVATPQVEQIFDLNSLGWYCQKASTDGSAWIACGSNEVNEHQIDGGVHLYAVQEIDGEVQVDEVAVVSMPVNSGSVSISGLGASNGGGSKFWLRAHNYAPYPRTRYSGWQMRAELTWGAVPVIKPEVSRRSYGQGTIQGVHTLAAGETKIIGHTLAGQVVNRLSVLDNSLLVLVGPGNVKLEVYDATTSTVLYTYSAATGADLRHASSRVDDTSQLLQSSGSSPAAGDVIHFRLVETTGTGSVTASAMCRYGWQFK